MRGRGRARFKDRNSPSPNPGHRHGSRDDVDRWSHDRYSSESGTNRQTSPYDDREALQGTEQQRSRLPCQQPSDRSSPVSRQEKNETQRTNSPASVDSDTSGRVRKSERSKNRRPDVQVYVPRARRQQPGQNGTENQASPDIPDATPRSNLVRQKKKEMERYVPRGRLEQQNKERGSAFQTVNQPTIDMPQTNIMRVESTKNVHKKIKVTDHAAAERHWTDKNSDPNPEQEVYQNEVGNEGNQFCDNGEFLQRDDSRTIANESPQCDLLDDSKNIPKHTSKYEHAPIDSSKCKQLDVSNDKDISDNTKHLPESSKRTENELNKVDLTGFYSDSADLTLGSTHPTAATTNSSSNSSAKNKLQEVYVEQAADGVKFDGNCDKSTIEESLVLSNDLKDMVEMSESSADTIKDNHRKISNLDNTEDVEMCSRTGDCRDLNENNSHGVKVTSLQSKEDVPKCANDSAVIHNDQEQQETYTEVDSEVDNVALKSALFKTLSENVTDSLNDDRIFDANVETNVNDTSEKFSGDKAHSEIVSTEVAIDSNKINTKSKCNQTDLEDEILTEQIHLTYNTVENQCDMNSVDTMDITLSYDDSCEDQKSSEYKDQDLSEKLVVQSASSHTDNSKLEQDKVKEEAQSENDTIDSNHSEVTEFRTSNQSENVTIDSSQSKEEEVDEDSWDAMFDDDGECLDPTVMEELTKTVGKVKIQKSKKINYLDYQPKDKSNFDFSQYEHIIEIYDFPAEFVTRDLIIAFQAFMSRGFDLKWVDDTHALGIFSSAIAAKDALQLMHPLLKVCPLSQASKQSQNKAKRCTEFLQPYKPRPETSAMAARRLVAGALGLATGVSREKRELERKQLKEAKAKKRQERQNRENIWEYGKCAMDEEP